MIVFVRLFVIVHPALLHLTYTVFVPSPAVNVCALVALHVAQLVGSAVFPHAISLPAGHKIFVNETLVVAVEVAHVLIRYVATSTVIVFALASSSTPPFAVPPLSCTWKVKLA